MDITKNISAEWRIFDYYVKIDDESVDISNIHAARIWRFFNNKCENRKSEESKLHLLKIKNSLANKVDDDKDQFENDFEE